MTTSTEKASYIENLIRQHQLPDEFHRTVEQFYKPLARHIAGSCSGRTKPLIVGVNGAQGTGKSTLSDFLGGILEHESGLTSAVLSLDDIYLTRVERKALAADVHPLLAVRGVPGTHDVALGLKVINTLMCAGVNDLTPIPAFDKGVDDRKPQSQWPTVVGRPDVIILEGWCLGAFPEPACALDAPINELEVNRDPDKKWRQFVNHQLAGDYSRLFGLIDLLVMIKAPSWEQVYAWRLLQENKLRQQRRLAGLDEGQLMNEEQIREFIAYYQRLTVHQLQEMPRRADVLLTMDAQHQITGMQVNV